MVTIQQIFDTAIHMIDEQNESSGATLTADTREYQVRTINILNSLIEQLYPYSDTYDASQPGRPVPKLAEAEDYRNPDFSQLVPLDDAIAIGVAPYGLAFHLLVAENLELAQVFRSLWMSALVDLRSKQAAAWEPIPTPYGLF